MNQVLSEIHDNFVRARRMQAIVGTSKFKEAYKKASKEELVGLNLIVEKCDPEELNNWVKDLKGGYEDMTKSELLFEAMKKRVSYYSRKSKDELITILKDLEA